MKLRKYQADLMQATRNAMSAGYKRPIVVLPCGGGKTVMFAYMASEHVARGGTVLFLVHRRELIAQTLDTFARVGIPLDGVHVGMVQSAKKLQITPTLIIFDECQHAVAATWRAIIDRWPSVYIVGLTATPKRTDGSSLAAVFDTLVNGVSAQWLIDNKYLAPYDYYAPRLSTIKQSDFVTKGSDYDLEQVSDIMLKSKIYGDIKKYIDPSRKTIIYAPSIEFSKSLANNIDGITHFDGTTPTAERDAIIADFRAGRIMALTNVDLIGEGFDVPDCEVIMLLRPTQSLVLYIQQAMRGLRYIDGKRATIYDLVGNVFTHGMPTQTVEWDLVGKIKSARGSADEVLVRLCGNCFRVYEGKLPICPYCGHDNGKTRVEIATDERVELERIEYIKKRDARREVGMSQSLDDLIKLGIKRGYKNPTYWAKSIINARRSKNGTKNY